MRNRRIFLLGLALILSISALWACETDPFAKYESMLQKGEPTNLCVWTYYNETQASAFDDIVQQFNQTVGMQKRITVTHVNYTRTIELETAIQNAAKGEKKSEAMPELFQSYADTLFSIDTGVEGGVAASLDKYFSKKEIDSFLPSMLNEGRFDNEGSLKLMPFAKSTEMFVLNKTAWDSFVAKTDAKTKPTLNMLESINSLIEVAKIYKEDTGKAFFGRDAVANLFYSAAAAFENDLFSINRDTMDATITFDREMFQKIYDAYYVTHVDGLFGGQERYRSDDFKVENVLSFVGSTSTTTNLPDKVNIDDKSTYDVAYQITTVPKFEGGRQTAYLQGAGFAVSQKDEKKEYASCIFLKFLTEPARNVHLAVEMSYIPVIKDALNENLVKEELTKSFLTKNELTDTPENRAKVISENTRVYQSYECTIRALQNSAIAQPVPFNNLYSVRKVFDTCLFGVKSAGMEELINADDMISLINADVEAGSTYEAAYEARMSNNFDTWFAALKTAIQSIIDE